MAPIVDIFSRFILLCVYAVRIVTCLEEHSIVEWARDSNGIELLSITESEYVPISPHNVSNDGDNSSVYDSLSIASFDAPTASGLYCAYEPLGIGPVSMGELSSAKLALRKGYPVGYIRGHGSFVGDFSGVDANISRFGLFGGGGSGSGSLEQLIEDNKTSGGVLLVDFYATWCRPCDTMKANLSIIESRYKPGKLVIHKIDVDQNAELSASYEITALPTLLLFRRGELVKRVRGVVDVSTLMGMINEALDDAS
ncbi:Thioredoxin family protein [Babesia bovis T2Bo]|uniref:Thioredoxin, putative n=1 Tax=Babesia bovis TaxID=5865 RepID=A7AWM3_BABBO|nr:Thioredoxin family protein [Babesia bovis T2Bo]EDO05451.1 Thioredoxin family protein [Babesia bovis T2Bo]|eukprot:XP_001609019.1 thioredoxin [Babesia bovis T2Bo]